MSFALVSGLPPMDPIPLYGSYDQIDADLSGAQVGHPKDRRDGGVPVFHRAYDGGAG